VSTTKLTDLAHLLAVFGTHRRVEQLEEELRIAASRHSGLAEHLRGQLAAGAYDGLDLNTRPQNLQAPANPPVAPGLPPTGAASCGQSDRRGVFTGDWLRDGCDCHTYTDGYVGDLVRHWNGWCMFRTTRTVAEVIVAQHQNTFTGLMSEHAGRGAHPADAWLATLKQFASITWLGPLIVVDRRLYTDDLTQVEITTPDAEGRYTIGWGWMWDSVELANVHTVHGAATS